LRGVFKNNMVYLLQNILNKNKTSPPIYQDKNNVLWIGTSSNGLLRYNAEKKTFSSFLPYPEQPEHKKNMVSAIIEDNEGKIWTGSHEGIFLFDPLIEKFLPLKTDWEIEQIYRQIFCFYKDSDRNIWIGTLKGLFKYETDNKEFTHIISGNNGNGDHLRDDAIASITGSVRSGKEVLWIATKNGLVRYDANNDSFIRHVIEPHNDKSISNDFINDLYLNENGILWIGTAWSGIDKLDIKGNHFHQVLLKSDDDRLHAAGAFCLDRKGYLWVGGAAAGLFKFDQQMKKVAHYTFEKGFTIDADSPITNHVDYIFEDSDDILWIGLCGWGPVIFDREKESFIYLNSNLPDEEHTYQERLISIIEDDSGTIWFSGNSIFKKDKNDDKYARLEHINTDSTKNHGHYELYEDSHGDIYFGVEKLGAYCLKSRHRDSMKFTHFGNDESEPGLFKSTVFEFYEDINRTLWAGSARGLNRFNRKEQKFELISENPSLFDDGISQVMGDQKGNLWMSRNTNGLLRYNPETKKIKAFDVGDGLPFDNITQLYWYQSYDGRIFAPAYLGDGKGFFYFHPDSITDNTNIPNIVITDFMVKDKPFPTDSSISAIKHIKLKYNQNFFSFQFAALDYTNPEKNQYAYYLEGLNEDWMYSGNRRYASFTSVPPGDYVFRVKGSNNDGYWNEAGTSLRITIFPPPWKTWWAYSLYLLFVISILIIVIRFYLRRQRLIHQLELEQVQTEKLEELDRIKSRFFANISHEFRTPLTLILGPIEKLRSYIKEKEPHQDLNIMQKNAYRLQKLIDQLLSLSKLESGKMKLRASEGNIVALVKGYVHSFESLAKQKGIVLKFSSDKENILLYFEQDKIEKILYNLLSNAFKFTDAGGQIEIIIRISADKEKANTNFVKISVNDTGTGIPKSKLEHIFDRFYQVNDSYTRDQEGTGIGLALVKELIDLHHGNITVKSDEGVGTNFTFFIPLGNEHLRNEEIVDRPASKTQDTYFQIPLESESSSESEILYQKPDTRPVLLIVEDNSDLRIYIRRHLNKEYNVSEATNGHFIPEGFNIKFRIGHILFHNIESFFQKLLIHGTDTAFG